MRFFLICLLVAAILCGPVHAASELELRGALPKDAGALLEDVPQGSSFSQGLIAILEKVVPSLLTTARASLRSIAIMLAALLLCALPERREGVNPATIAGVLAISSAGMLEVHALAAAGQEAVYQLQSFADLLLPAMAAATAATGGITVSTALYAGTAFFTDVLMHAMTDLFLPMTYAYVAMKAAHSLCGNQALTRIAQLIRWALHTGMKALLFLFTAYIGITGLLSGTADATIVKAAKLTLSGVVPVVGSMISDASETVILGALTMKNAIGVVGMLAVISICIGPFVRTGVQYLMMKLACAAGGSMGSKELLSLMDAISDALGFLLAMTAASAVMLLISCVCYLKVAV